MGGLRNLHRTRGADRDLIYLLLVSRKYGLEPSSLGLTMLAALREGQATCGELLIQPRTKSKGESTFLFMKDGRPVAQATIPVAAAETLLNLPEEFQRFFRQELRPRRTESGKANRIDDLEVGTRGVEIQATVINKSEVRAVTSRNGTPLLVCSATLSDGTGEIRLPLWNSQIGSISEGDTVHVQNATVTTFQGRKQLSLLRRNGKLTVVDHPKA